MGTAEADVTRYARLHFGKGDPLDLIQPVSEWDQADFEREWRAEGVTVEWLRSPRGRLDRALEADPAEVIVTSGVDNSAD